MFALLMEVEQNVLLLLDCQRARMTIATEWMKIATESRMTIMFRL
jgi:hypothetical protein